MRKPLAIAGALVALLLTAPPSPASGPGTYLASFLEIDPGARQMGMGGAFVGLADDAIAAYYNPAGLRFLTGSEVHFNNATWPAGLSYQYLAYGFRHSFLPGSFGLSWTVLQMSPYLEKTEYFNPESGFGVGIHDYVDAGDMAFGGSYCWDFGGGLSAGATLKWYHLAMAEAFCEGVCGDLGVLYDTAFRNLRVGAVIQNIGPSNRWARTGSPTGFGEDFPLPVTYRAGASMRIYDVVRHRVVVAGDYKRPPYGQHKAHVGVEYTFNRGPIYVYGRAGYRFGYDEESFTAGVGARFPSSAETEARVDYAYVDMGRLDYSQRIALNFAF